MKQITKFYISSFLKNQTYFVPVFVVILQLYQLSYIEIFLIFTLSNVLKLFIEIPTGIFADIYGKRRSIQISKLLILLSFIGFGFSWNFWTFLVFQLLYELGNAFRSGTETGYVYDYIQQNPENPSYTKVKGNQKFYARIGEGIATTLGGFIAAGIGYSAVFFFAAIPAFINFIFSLTWEKIKESEKGITKTDLYSKFQSSYHFIKNNSYAVRLILNVMIFTGGVAAISKLIQPYMQKTIIPIEYFGIVYTVFLVIAAFAVKYSYIFEEKFGKIIIINLFSILSAVLLFVVGYGYVGILGILILFLVITAENIRSPISNTLFHENIDSEKRSTLGSTLELGKALAGIIIMPIVGLLSDSFSIFYAVMFLAVLLLLNSIVFNIRQR
ncbi:MFS transporter [Candidatus Absconditicoccus praedator]|uniref:MFS transporter n=1 Tax=Candidatus Absconditicoccus praedator TaxID=2735562 RepID=UPI001E37A129|nr:MFS transporter [Candidatus Absconditicoccus praedator]UFX82581.1 MFS transporter [Candidatus Absconditicoccus praedator]